MTTDDLVTRLLVTSTAAAHLNAEASARIRDDAATIAAKDAEIKALKASKEPRPDDGWAILTFPSRALSSWPARACILAHLALCLFVASSITNPGAFAAGILLASLSLCLLCLTF